MPELAHRLHDELDRASASYLWSFLDGNWDAMEAGGLTEPSILDRLIHRRASVQLGRLDDADGQPRERPVVEGGAELSDTSDCLGLSFGRGRVQGRRVPRRDSPRTVTLSRSQARRRHVQTLF